MAISTTAGDVRSGDLGFTSMHEHVACWFDGRVRDNYLWDPNSDARDQAMAQAVRKVSAGREAGIDAIVDLTTVDIGRDVPFIAEVAKRTGVSIVVSAGLLARSPPGGIRYFRSIGVEQTADLITRDLTEGVMSTDVKAGVLKAAIAPEENLFNPASGELEAAKSDEPRPFWGGFGLKVAAVAHRRTGALINVHTHSGTKTGLMACDVLEDAGVHLSRVLIHHVGDTDDLDYLRAMLARGAFLSMDPHWNPWHYGTVVQLCAEGYSDRLTLGIDSVNVADWDPVNAFEGVERERIERETAMAYLPLQVVPNLLAAGCSPEAIEAMTRANPVRLIEFATRTLDARKPATLPSSSADDTLLVDTIAPARDQERSLAATVLTVAHDCRPGCDHTH